MGNRVAVNEVYALHRIDINLNQVSKNSNLWKLSDKTYGAKFRIVDWIKIKIQDETQWFELGIVRFMMMCYSFNANGGPIFAPLGI